MRVKFSALSSSFAAWIGSMSAFFVVPILFFESPALPYLQDVRSALTLIIIGFLFFILFTLTSGNVRFERQSDD